MTRFLQSPRWLLAAVAIVVVNVLMIVAFVSVAPDREATMLAVWLVVDALVTLGVLAALDRRRRYE